MAAATVAGGNCVAGAIARTESGSIMGIEEALGCLAVGREVVVRPGVREFGLRLLPLLRLIGSELKVGDAIAEIERRLMAENGE
jgi:hypothetical protein